MKKYRYEQIAEAIAEKIQKGIFPVGSLIPPERKLAEGFKVSSIVVNKALLLLSHRGIIDKKPRKGNIVLRLPEPGMATDMSFQEELSVNIQIRKKHIRLAVLGDFSAKRKLWEKILRAYTGKRTDVEIEFVHFDSMDELSGKMGEIDIAYILASYLPGFVRKDLLFDIDEFGGLDLDPQEYYQAFINSSSCGGRFWGIPIAVSVCCSFVNKKFMKEFALPYYPESFWEYYETLLEVYRKTGRYPLEMNSYNLFDYFRLSGAEPGNSFQDMMKLDRKEYRDFLNDFKLYFVDNPLVMPKTMMGESGIQKNFETAEVLSMGSFCILVDALAPEVLEKWELFPSASEALGHIPASAMLMTISSFTKYPEECFDILKYLKTYEVQRQFALGGVLNANIQTGSDLCIKGRENVLPSSIRESFKRAAVCTHSLSCREHREYTQSILNMETEKWKNGEYGLDEFIDALKRKTDFFIRGVEKKKAIAKLH